MASNKATKMAKVGDEWKQVEADKVPEVDSAPDGAPQGDVVMQQVPTPEHTNPLSYTAVLQLNNFFFAVDDFTEEELAEFQAAENQAIEAQRAAHRESQEWRLSISRAQERAQGATGEALDAIVEEINEASNALLTVGEAYKAGVVAQSAVWKEWTLRKIKGVKQGKDFVPCSGVPPIATVPAYKAIAAALVTRATLGQSELDFLG